MKLCEDRGRRMATEKRATEKRATFGCVERNEEAARGCGIEGEKRRMR